MRGSGKFTKFDYGPEANLLKYGSCDPPIIDLSKITNKIPTALFVGKQDELATCESASWLKSQLGNSIIHYKEYENVNHSSFTMGKDIGYLKDVIRVLNLLKIRNSQANSEIQVI